MLPNIIGKRIPMCSVHFPVYRLNLLQSLSISGCCTCAATLVLCELFSFCFVNNLYSCCLFQNGSITLLFMVCVACESLSECCISYFVSYLLVILLASLVIIWDQQTI